MPRDKAIIAISTGDSAGIGPEVALKAGLDPAVRAACHPVMVSDPGLIERHATACGIGANLNMIARIGDADWSGRLLNLLVCPQPEAARLDFGVTHAASGHASLAFASCAIQSALAGEVDAVVAAPQNEAAIALAGIPFDGHPSFVARETGSDPDDVYLMLCVGEMKIVHATLHRSVRDAVVLITRERVLRVIRAAGRTLRQMGVASPMLAVSGLNPHAGEGGLFGTEEIEIIKPAIDAAVADGCRVIGPLGADTMFHRQGVDAFIVMLHDQGHIPAKLLAPNATAAMTIGTQILFSSVAHGSAHDIAGKGIADPGAMIEAVLRLSNVRSRRS